MEVFNFKNGEGQRVRIYMDEDGKIYVFAQDLAKVLGMKTAELAKQTDGWKFLRDEDGQTVRCYPEAAFWQMKFTDEKKSCRLAALHEEAENNILPNLRGEIATRQFHMCCEEVKDLYGRLLKLARDTVELAEKFSGMTEKK